MLVSRGRYFALLSTTTVDARDRFRSTMSSGAIFLTGSKSLGSTYELLFHVGSNPSYVDSAPYAYTETIGVLASNGMVWTGSNAVGPILFDFDRVVFVSPLFSSVLCLLK